MATTLTDSPSPLLYDIRLYFLYFHNCLTLRLKREGKSFNLVGRDESVWVEESEKTVNGLSFLKTPKGTVLILLPVSCWVSISVFLSLFPSFLLSVFPHPPTLECFY